jgi:hypothetical protein
VRRGERGGTRTVRDFRCTDRWVLPDRTRGRAVDGRVGLSHRHSLFIGACVWVLRCGKTYVRMFSDAVHVLWSFATLGTRHLRGLL